jgi:Uma2 family endonuclease
MSHATHKPYVPKGIILGEPTWDVAQLFPHQGAWSEGDYLELNTHHLVEFSHGYVEFLPRPTIFHQRILKFLFYALQEFVTAGRLGEVLPMGVRVHLWPGKIRKPDVAFLRAEHAGRVTEDYWEGADSVMEVVSDGDEDRLRDLKTKREEYAKAAIPEYWIVDPKLGRITVLTLDGSTYAVHGEFSAGQQATSRLLPGFAVDVTAVLAASGRNEGGLTR